MITDKTSGWVEPTITINGEQLSFSQAMAVRVAISSYRMFVCERTNRINIGERSADAYNDRLLEVEILMHRDKS